jgi:hypothetical protein
MTNDRFPYKAGEHAERILQLLASVSGGDKNEGLLMAFFHQSER